MRLSDIALVIRSRNAGPRGLTLPFTPPEAPPGLDCHFNVHHLMRVGDPDALLPMDIEAL